MTKKTAQTADPAGAPPPPPSFVRFAQSLVEACGITLDVSRAGLPEDWEGRLRGAMETAFHEMEALEGGAIANPDEGRMVGHYWLRAPGLAPDPSLAAAIRSTVDRIEAFAGEARREGLEHLLVIGIGGSALGPQLASDALVGPGERVRAWFFDNTDPDGMARTLAALEGRLGSTLVVTVSKSGGTLETRNGMLTAAQAYAQAGLSFARHAVAVTMEGSALDRHATGENWRARFPIWDWVGGRTSQLSAVGLLPAALQGVDIRALLAGAAAMDAATRVRSARENPAALLAAVWHVLGDGRGGRSMVVLPYRDRLLLFSRYLQQLVMESLGKERDREGNLVHQGLTVYGNKGSTDQHAFVQQLRDGRNDFFALFVQVLEDGPCRLQVEEGTTSGDHLHAFLLGTRQALGAKGRPSVTLTLPRLDAFHLGALLALFERAVGLYASLIDVNAYHQPGVEAGKRSAARVVEVQRMAVSWLSARPGGAFTAWEVAVGLALQEEVEVVFKVLEHLSANRGRGIARGGNSSPLAARFRAAAEEE